MNEVNLKRAIAEAERFLKAARAAMDHLKTMELCGNQYTAAAKRASMDLTRALAIIRGRSY